ncbi:MAG: hypothetical protein Q8M16_08965 [Pirellulaceae bacterium]|nr:hypothetical protein [Pirellulaceae bacterium]
MKRIRWTTWCGLAIWIAGPLVAWLAVCMFVPFEELSGGSGRLWRQWQSRSVQQSAVTQDVFVINYRDPVFSYDANGKPIRIGHVVSPTEIWAPTGTEVQIQLYDSTFPWSTGRLELHRPNRNLSRVAEVMLTEDRLERLQAILLQVRQQHQAEVSAELAPIIRQAFLDLRPVIEDELRTAITDHRPQLDQLSEKYRLRIVNQRLVPLVQSEILPVVQKHATPLLENIGGEMWQKVSLWRFAWRYVYDGSVGPSEKLVQQEWRRFMDQHAMPILQAHSQDFVEVQTVIVRELAANPQVTQAIRDSLGEVLDDADAWAVVRSILAQAITNNPQVQQKLRSVLQSPETQASLNRIGEQMEPYAVRIGTELFGTPQEVNKEFALVLRHMILNKDEQWLVWVPTASGATSSAIIPIETAAELGVPPFFLQSPTHFDSEDMTNSQDGP